MHQLHLIIAGDVHGVFFRAETRAVALSLELTGWVRNCADGSVEVVAQGDQESLQKLLTWCGKGPQRAAVASVVVDWTASDKKEFNSFEIQY